MFVPSPLDGLSADNTEREIDEAITAAERHDCLTELATARHTARATWVCSCGKDVSVAYVVYHQALSQSCHP